MKIYDIDTLKKVDGSYDLTQPTFQDNFSSIVYNQYEVQKGEEMRIDLICQSIYKNTDFVDILLNVNSIDNPLNIQEGTILIYPTNNIELLRYSGRDENETVQILGNSNKQQRKDKNRRTYVENKLSLPPTVLQDRTTQYDISTDRIFLGDGLF